MGESSLIFEWSLLSTFKDCTFKTNFGITNSQGRQTNQCYSVPWHWLFFALPQIFTLKPCLQASLWSLASRWYWLFWCLASKWNWLLLPPIGALANLYYSSLTQSTWKKVSPMYLFWSSSLVWNIFEIYHNQPFCCVVVYWGFLSTFQLCNNATCETYRFFQSLNYLYVCLT